VWRAIKISDISDYFEIAGRKGAVLLDTSNFRMRSYPILSCIRDSLNKIKSGSVELGYDDPSGSCTLRELIAIHESYYEGIELSSSNVVVNSGGVTGSFSNVFQYISKSNRKSSKNEVIIPTPSYGAISRGVLYEGLRPVFVPTSFKYRFQSRSEDIKSKISDRTLGIFLTSPGNPCCSYLDNEELKKIINLAQEIDSFVVLDAIFEEASLNFQKQRFFSISDYRKLIKITGPSKDRPHMNDFRVGWSISRDIDVIKGLYLASEVAGFSVSRSIDEIMKSEMSLRICKDRYDREGKVPDKNYPTFIRYTKEVKSFFKKIREGLNIALDLCQGYTVVDKIYVPEVGNLLFLKVGKHHLKSKGVYNDDSLSKYVFDKVGITITPGHFFMANPNEIWFRVTMAMDPEEFRVHLKNVLDCLK